MTQHKAGYPLDYSKGSAEAGKDRLREMADTGTDKMKDVIRRNQVGLGPWFQRLTSFTIDYPRQWVEATVLAIDRNRGLV